MVRISLKAWCAGALAAVAICGCLVARAQDETETAAKADLLTIGSAAPTLDIEHWVQDGKGRFRPVKSFEPGKVYVVEFWATWCGPCIHSMPHLSETQTKYYDKGVTIISVSDEDLETVNTFLERAYTPEEGDASTYRDLTSTYCLTTDPDGSTHSAYMAAAQQNGIPTAFLVGKDGAIEWIGHPMEMDAPLEQVVAGTWDRDAFMADFKAQQELQSKMNEIFSHLRSGETDDALKLLEEVISSTKDADMKLQLQMLQFQLVLTERPDDAVKLFSGLVQSNRDNAMLLNQLSWSVFEMLDQGTELSADMKKQALEAAEFAAKAAPEDGAILDTLAHWLHVHGELDRAIEVQTKAAKNPGPAAAEIEAFLKQLKEEKAGKDKGETIR